MATDRNSIGRRTSDKAEKRQKIAGMGQRKYAKDDLARGQSRQDRSAETESAVDEWFGE